MLVAPGRLVTSGIIKGLFCPWSGAPSYFSCCVSEVFSPELQEQMRWRRVTGLLFTGRSVNEET